MWELGEFKQKKEVLKERLLEMLTQNYDCFGVYEVLKKRLEGKLLKETFGFFWKLKNLRFIFAAFLLESVSEKRRTFLFNICRGSSSVGRASAFQAECRRFEPGLPLKKLHRKVKLFLFQEFLVKKI